MPRTYTFEGKRQQRWTQAHTERAIEQRQQGPALGAALIKAALAEKEQQAEQPAEALAETPECEAKCGVTSIELPPAVAALLAGALAGELDARKEQKSDA